MVAALNNKAAALLGQKRLEEAYPLLQEVLKIDRKSWQAYTNLGIVLGGRGDVAGARAALDEAVRLKPDNPKAQELLKLVEEELARRKAL